MTSCGEVPPFPQLQITVCYCSAAHSLLQGNSSDDLTSGL